MEDEGCRMNSEVEDIVKELQNLPVIIDGIYSVAELISARERSLKENIEQLERENAELRNVAKSASMIGEKQMYQIADLEARIAKAVGILERFEGTRFSSQTEDISIDDAIKVLKGAKE